MLRKLLVEIRYRDGQRYLDRCGILLRGIMTDPNWVLAQEPNPQGTNLLNISTQVKLSISLASTSFTIDQPPPNNVINEDEFTEFREQGLYLLSRIVDEFEITEFDRCGFREQYYFPFDDKDSCEKWIQNLGLFTVHPALYEKFGTTHGAIGINLTMEGETSHIRFSIQSMERSAELSVSDSIVNFRQTSLPKHQREALKKALKQDRTRKLNAQFMVVLDIDAYHFEREQGVIVEDLLDHHATNLTRFRDAIEATKQAHKSNKK